MQHVIIVMALFQEPVCGFIFGGLGVHNSGHVAQTKVIALYCVLHMFPVEFHYLQ